MAKQTYNNPIDKNVSWGGDDNTGGLPVSGAMVQKFIKDEFENRFGYLHKDQENNRYLVFADEANCNKYFEDTVENASLLLGTFDAPFNYEAEINLTTPSYNAVFLGSRGNYLEYTFDVKNKQGASTGENGIVTYTITHNANKKTITNIHKSNSNIQFNLDEYLEEGNNTITINVVGQTTLASTTVALVYQVVDLSISDEFDISKDYNLTKAEETYLDMSFTVAGYGTKYVEWYLDGQKLATDSIVDVVVETSTTRPKTIDISTLSVGKHNFQWRAYVNVNGENFYTDTLYREFIVHRGTNTEVGIAVALTIPRGYDIVANGSEPVIYDMVQYVPYTLNFATYSPANAASTNVDIYLDDVLQTSVSSTNRIVNKVSLVSKTPGSKTLKLAAGTVEVSFDTEIAETTMNLYEISSDLVLDFSAVGMTNNSANKENWSYGDYTGTFTGLNWNDTSGYFNDYLLLSNGSSFEINYAPLADNFNNGKTIELELYSTNVVDDDAVLLDLRNENGTGLLLTATKISLISTSGKIMENHYKADEPVRFAIVINRATGSTNKCLSFIYSDGVASRCISWNESDNFISDKTIKFTATDAAQMGIRYIRIYNNVLSSDQALNNYILYRPSMIEMMDVYNRNDIYNDGGTGFDPEKLMTNIPVMMVTGNIPVLENTNDKNEQITVDIEYTNPWDPSKSFTLENAAMRPQGTSSMGYPKKNFRIYTQKVAGTKLYVNGKLKEDNLYSFKEGAQPVNCWCLKADYAESSGTHNTGIARLWNEVLVNAQIDGEYKLRTNAQTAAFNAGYEYDVRTTIDGFPILMFYRLNEGDEWIFIGKYNFNNDKSTESVFGFRDIPNFDHSKVECWECLNNGHPLGLFTDVSTWDTAWEEAFEGRYPDGNKDTTALKAFATWLSGINGNATAFASEKWDHLDVYKVAAYYIYLMRFGGVDQTVKNSMLTTEDGQKWYYINYDNDTINGLTNGGYLTLPPTIDRQSVDNSGTYVYAGHDSVLWNMLEGDSEFMQIVKTVDNALYTAGLRYDEVIDMFNEKQAAQWVERVYNQDAQYKYIGPKTNENIDNLFMLQGNRSTHRAWWLNKRFSYYDSLFLTGAYKSNAIQLKYNVEEQASMKITAGVDLNYGYGINFTEQETGVALERGETHNFVTPAGFQINQGDVVYIYTAPNIKELDFSATMEKIQLVDVTNAYDPVLGTKLTKLVIGNPNSTNLQNFTLSGLGQYDESLGKYTGCYLIEHLDVQGITGLSELDLSGLPYLTTLKAKGSNINTVTFAHGAPITTLDLPSTYTQINFVQLPYLTTSGITIDGGYANVQKVYINNCPKLSTDFNFAYNWYKAKTHADSTCSLYMDNVLWENVDPTKFLELLQLKHNGGNFDLKGKATMPNATIEVIYAIRDIFGESAFDPDSEFYVEVPTVLEIEKPANEILDGDSMQLDYVLYPILDGTVTYSMIAGRDGCAVDPTTGLVTTTEAGAVTSDIKIGIDFVSADGAETAHGETTISVVKRTYPADGTIEGSSDPRESLDYTWNTTTENVNGSYTVNWALSGTAATYLRVASSSNTGCKLAFRNSLPSTTTGTLIMTVVRNYDNATIVTATKDLSMTVVFPTDATITGPDNPLEEPRTYTWSTTTENVNGDYLVEWSLSGDITSVVQIESQDENQCITGYLDAPTDLIEGTLTLTLKKKADYSVILTATKDLEAVIEGAIITSKSNAGIQAALYAAGLVANENYTLQSEAETITAEQLQPGTSSSTSIFYAQRDNITHFEEFRYFTGVTSIPAYLFAYCNKLKRLIIPRSVTTIKKYAFTYNYSYHTECDDLLYIPDTVTTIESGSFYSTTDCTKNLYIDSIDWFLSSATQYLPYASSSSYTRNLYLASLDENMVFSGTKITNVVIPDSITSIKSYAFAYSNISSVTFHDAVTIINSYAFAGNAITNLLLPVSLTTISDRAFESTTSLQRISGDFAATVTYNAFNKTNSDVTLEEYVPFGLFTGPNNVSATPSRYTFSIYSPMALAYGDAVFFANSGLYFNDMTNQRTLNLSYTGAIEDLSPRLEVWYRTLTITSDQSDAEFTLSYTDKAGSAINTTVTPGSHVLMVDSDTEITITPVSEIEDYTKPAAKIVTLASTTSYAFDYTENVDIYIQHTDGNLYTSEEWTAGGYSNDNANGVAVVRPVSGSFVIAKEDVSTSLKWGGYNKTITDIVTATDSAIAVKDNAGINNTPQIISQLTGYTDSQSVTGAPAAEACAAYVFPNGSTGYLGALGEWKAAYDNKASIVSLMSQIGGTTINTSEYYWTSTQRSSYDSWGLTWNYGGMGSSGKNNTYYVRAFSAPLLLSINCNRSDVEFQVTYTKFRNGGEKTITLKPGIHNTVVPQLNTTVTISVAPGYEWAEMDVNTQTFTYTGSPITATFVTGVESGVYIQHTNGALYTTTEWADGGYSNDTANGVAVIDSSCAFTIAKEDAGTSLKWGGYNKTITDIVTSTSSSTAVLDFDGEGNTTKIIEQLTGYTDSQSVTGAPAAEACANYTFPNGSNGYLPSLGEWYAAYNNKTAIVEAMSLIGGTAISTSNYYWTSTQNSSNRSWYLGWTSGYMLNYNKSYTNYVRAFSAL